MTHEQVQAGLGAYVLGACPPREAELVAQHLASCEDCAEEARRLRAVPEALLAAQPPISPPPEVKQRVMAQVRADAELFDAARADQPRPARTGRRSWLSPPTWLRGRGLAVGATACAALAAGGGLLAAGIDSRPEPRIVNATVDERIAAGGSAVVELGSGDARLRVRDLPEPGSGRAYQVWLRDGDGLPRPAGVMFGVSAQGDGEAELPPDAEQADELLVTSEPVEGSRSPTRLPLVRAPV